jgi:hypothetical protein
MQRSSVPVSVLILAFLFVVGSLWLRPLRAQETRGSKAVAARPGDAAYMPTKLEWAALELQASYGSTVWTSETPVTITFLAMDDGVTVLCLLQYTPDVPAQVVKVDRDVEQSVFDKYVQRRGWSWLRLEFQEKTLPRPSH